jgi:hypothetical protein
MISSGVGDHSLFSHFEAFSLAFFSCHGIVGSIHCIAWWRSFVAWHSVACLVLSLSYPVLLLPLTYLVRHRKYTNPSSSDSSSDASSSSIISRSCSPRRHLRTGRPGHLGPLAQWRPQPALGVGCMSSHALRSALRRLLKGGWMPSRRYQPAHPHLGTT